MKIVYSLPHPVDRLETEQAGHIVRANAMLKALEELGHEIIRVQAAATPGNFQSAVKGYRSFLKGLLPPSILRPIRDRARAAFGRNYASHLTTIVNEVQPDIILETHIAFSSGGVLASRNTNIPIIFDDVAPVWEEQIQYGVGSNRLATKIHKEVMSQASLVVAVSRTIQQALLEDGVNAEKIITISNGFDDELFRPDIDGKPIRQKYAIPQDGVVIVFVGSFQPYHRIDLLLAASKLIRSQQPVYLLIIGGDDEQLDQYQSSAKEIFVGRIPNESVPAHIAAGDIAVMPATNSFGNPMKIYEYMAMAKTVIAPDQPTIREIASHGDGIFLFEPKNVADLARALEKNVANKQLRQTLGSRALELSQFHTWHERAKTLVQAMSNVTN